VAIHSDAILSVHAWP